jgi:polar amino acid transport system permease protein
MSHADVLILPQPAPKNLEKPMTLARFTGCVVVGLWIVLAVALVAMIITGWDIEKFTRYGPRYLHGLMTTITLVAVSVVCGAVLSLPLAFARMSKNKIIGGLAFAYVYVFRGTPLLAQLFLIYYGLGQFRPQLEGRRPVVVLPRCLVLRPVLDDHQHRGLSGGDPARRHRERPARPA